MSDSLQPHESQHARPPCPSPTPGVHSNSCPLSQWCHPDISSSVVPFSSCPQSLQASGSFPMSQVFAWGSQSIGVSASASVLPMDTQDWSPLGWTCWISLQSKGLSRVFSNTTIQKHQFFGAQLSSQYNSHILIIRFLCYSSISTFKPVGGLLFSTALKLCMGVWLAFVSEMFMETACYHHWAWLSRLLFPCCYSPGRMCWYSSEIKLKKPGLLNQIMAGNCPEDFSILMEDFIWGRNKIRLC